MRVVVRQGSGEVFAVEGEEVRLRRRLGVPGDVWTEPCGAYSGGDIAWINDAPAHPAVTAVPSPPTVPVPTRAASAEELGWYAVPTVAWDPARAGDGDRVSFAGSVLRDGGDTVEQWTTLCPGSPVDRRFMVQDTRP